MANVVEEGGAPSSNIVGGAASATKTFTMPASVALDVQTVVATIDNSAGASPVTATVTIADQGGEVIDANAQEDTIPAGGTGTATFARRLAGKGGGLRFGRLNVGNWLNVRTTGDLNPDTGGITFEVEKSEFGIYVTDAATGAFHVEAPFVFYDVGGGVYRIINSSLVEVNADEVTVTADTGGIALSTTDGGINLSSANDPITLYSPTANIYMTAEDLQILLNNALSITALSSMLLNCRAHVLEMSLYPAGTAVRVTDQTGNPIFEVRADGSLHGKTGQALTFDL